MNKEELQSKLLETFKVEADEHLRAIADGLLRLEKSPGIEEFVATAELLHREAHSLKGAARAVNLLEIELIFHAVEKIFLAWKRHELKSAPHHFDTLHQTINHLQQAISKSPNEKITLDKQIATEIVARLNGLLTSNTPVTPSDKVLAKANFEYLTPTPTVRIENSKLDSLLLKTEEMLMVKLVMQKYINEFTRMDESIRAWKNQWRKMVRNKSPHSLETFLVDGYDRIKSFESAFTDLHFQFEAYGRQFNTLIDGLLDDAKDMVMLPFSTLLDSLPTMVRNLSREQGKVIHLFLDGTDIKVDKRILDELKDPLIHIIRNSIDHGIEKPENRKNKETFGTIKVFISPFSGNEVEITISDDGAGIDINAVKKSAIKLGLLSPMGAQVLNDEDALSLIFHSGVSTSPIITNVSGQGLGMAIVYEKIEKIGGNIQIKSEYGMGTEIKMVLPLSLTTFKGILINTADQSFVLPTAHLERIIRISKNEIVTIENKETFVLDSESISLVKLSDVLGIQSSVKQKTDNKYIFVAILQVGEHRAGFLVDDIASEQEVIVKKLAMPLLRVKYIAATTILENGVPVPILNSSDLMKAVMKDTATKSMAATESSELVIDNKIILLVEDSITTRVLLKNILEMAGYQVKTAADGAEAWCILHESDIALVVSDVEMPRMNGFELTKNIRNDKKMADLPVILVTTRESPEDREYGILVGANAYIAKSNFDDNNLIATVKRLL